MSILAIRFNRRQEKISMPKLHNSINILHIPMNATLPKLHICKATIPEAPHNCFL